MTADSTVLGSSLPARVGVLGGGRMGAGIAHAFALAGSIVSIVERDEPAATSARERVIRDLQQSIARGAADSGIDELTSRIRTGCDIEAFRETTLVVEAVPEEPALKHESLERIEAVVSPDAVIATNTSSLSITELALTLQAPERFIGLHFFNPVPASSLVEIVVGEKTSNALAESAKSWVEALGKTPVTVQDAPGFASSRLGVAIGLEAIRMVEEEVASPEDIDTAMVLGYRFPIGPLRLTDIVGLDVRLQIAEYLHSTLGERFRPPELLRQKVAAGELGRKSGKGFFDWPATEGTVK